MKQGPHEKQIIDACIKRGTPLPEAIANAPELYLGLSTIYTAFADLSSCRSIGMGAGPIPWTSINAYALRHGITDEEEFGDMLELIRKMDNAWLEYSAAQSKKASAE